MAEMTARLDQPLTVEDIAARSGVSPRTLSRHFTEQLGVSPGRWLLERRIATTRALNALRAAKRRPAPAAQPHLSPGCDELDGPPWSGAPPMAVL